MTTVTPHFAISDSRILELVRTLENSCQSLEADIGRINIDLSQTEDCIRRYGSDCFVQSQRYLYNLREEKKSKYREVIDKLEQLKHQLETSTMLVTQLAQPAPGLQVNIVRPLNNNVSTVRSGRGAY